RAAVDDPDRVVEVDHVHTRNGAVRVHEVRVEPRDVPGHLREELRGVETDDVLSGLDVDRPVAVGQVLDALVVDVGNLARLVLDCRTSGGVRAGRGNQKRPRGAQ